MRAEAGYALLELVLAITILTVAGLGLAGWMRESAHTAAAIASRDAELTRASAFLDLVALWPSEDLDRRLGSRRQGIWRLTIQRPTPDLYEVQLADSMGFVLLATTLYRAPLQDRNRP